MPTESLPHKNRNRHAVAVLRAAESLESARKSKEPPCRGGYASQDSVCAQAPSEAPGIDRTRTGDFETDRQA
jgi:hypothetical protein